MSQLKKRFKYYQVRKNQKKNSDIYYHVKGSEMTYFGSKTLHWTENH